MMSSNTYQALTPMVVIGLLTTNDDKKFAPAARMAAAIIEITQELGGCLPQDLNKKGFAPEEVYQHWHMASSLATVEMKLMDEDSALFKSIIRRK